MILMGIMMLLSQSITIKHYSDVIMSAMASQITGLIIVYSTVYSGADQRKHQGSASLAFVGGIHWGPVNSPHKWPVTRKLFSFDDVIMDLAPDIHIIHCGTNPIVQIKSMHPICRSGAIRFHLRAHMFQMHCNLLELMIDYRCPVKVLRLTHRITWISCDMVS